MRKFFLLLLTILLTLTLVSCKDKAGNESVESITPDSIDEKSLYIRPLNDSEVFEHIGDDGIKSDLRTALDGKITPNYVLKMLGKPVPDMTVTDYGGNDYSFDDGFFVLELVASWCEHCQAQAREYNEELLKEGVRIVQYFNADDNDGIDRYYEAVGKRHEGVVLLPHSDELTKFVETVYEPLYYPTFIVFNEGRVVYATSGHLSIFDLSRAQKVIGRKLDPDKLVDVNGADIFEGLVSYADVEKELGETKCEALKAIDHDGNTYVLTISNIGRKIDFEALHHFGGQYVNEVSDFKEMAEGDQIILAIGDPSENDRLNDLVNDLSASDHDVGVYVMTLGNVELNDHPGCKVFASRAAIPADLAGIDTASALTAIFLKDGVIAGIYSDPQDIMSVYDLFLGEDALVFNGGN